MAGGVVVLVITFAFVIYIPFSTFGNPGNNGISTTPSGLPYSVLYVIFGGIAAMVACFLIGGRYARSVYKDAIGKVFEITRLRSMFKGIARFEGMNMTIQCTEQLAVGDRVKATGTDTFYAGRSRVMVLLGTKLSPDSPEYNLADQDTTMSPIM